MEVELNDYLKELLIDDREYTGPVLMIDPLGNKHTKYVFKFTSEGDIKEVKKWLHNIFYEAKAKAGFNLKSYMICWRTPLAISKDEDGFTASLRFTVSPFPRIIEE